MKRPRQIALLSFLLLLAAIVLHARAKNKQPNGNSFSYYMLVLSYAPDFCAQPGGNKDPRECGAGRHVGFIVHGLWPQRDDGGWPENCGSASPVAGRIVQMMVGRYFPTESLLQHEWKAHGTCSGLSADDYFAAVRKTREMVNVPSDFTSSTTRTVSLPRSKGI